MSLCSSEMASPIKRRGAILAVHSCPTESGEHALYRLCCAGLYLLYYSNLSLTMSTASVPGRSRHHNIVFLGAHYLYFLMYKSNIAIPMLATHPDSDHRGIRIAMCMSKNAYAPLATASPYCHVALKCKAPNNKIAASSITESKLKTPSIKTVQRAYLGLLCTGQWFQIIISVDVS